MNMEEHQTKGSINILEVGLDYPYTLQVEHSSFPLAPQRVKVAKSMLIHKGHHFRDHQGRYFHHQGKYAG